MRSIVLILLGLSAVLYVEALKKSGKADMTHYTSYPEPGSQECIEDNGCKWAGQFAFLDKKQSKEWVKSHHIIALHEKDAKKYKLKKFRVTQGSHHIDAIVYDECSDSDCNGCCTKNSKKSGFLIDMEDYTLAKFGGHDGVVEWTCLDC